jgi:hypothetical protein
LVQRKQLINVSDITPLPKPKNKASMKTGRKSDRSEETTGFHIEQALKIEGKACTKTLDLDKCPKAQRRKNVSGNKPG